MVEQLEERPPGVQGMSSDPHKITMTVRGKVGSVVYQRVHKGKGNIPTPGHYDLQVRALGTHTDRRSPAQLALRARIRDATAAYKALTPEDRATWKARARKSKATGYNLFVRDYCQQHPISEP